MGTVAVTALVALTWLVLRWHVVILLLFAAVIICTAISPLVEWMYRRGVPRHAGIIVVYALLLALLASFLLWGAPLMAQQASRIAEAISVAYDGLRQRILQTSNLLLWRLSVALPEQPPFLSPTQPSGDESTPPVAEVARMAGLAVRTVFLVVITFVMAFYWTVEGPRIKRAAQLLLPQKKRGAARGLMAEVESSLSHYLAGKAS